MQIAATQLRPGMVVKFNNDLFSIFKMEHRTPGNLRGFVQVKMRNFKSGTMIEHRFSSEDRVEKASLDEQEMEYLYDDGEYFYFMNTTTFEQMHLIKDLLGDGSHWGISISYAVQPSPDGLAQAFIIGKEFVGDAPSALIQLPLGLNIPAGAKLQVDDGKVTDLQVQTCETRAPLRLP